MQDRTIEVLRQEPDLAAGLDEADRERARRDCIAPLMQLEKGVWDPRGSQLAAEGFGMLVISGYLVRRVGQGGRFGAELLGPGDLLRPWRSAGEGDSLYFEPVFGAITPIKLAVLDYDFARRAAPFPTIGIQLADRAMHRSRRLAITMAIFHQPRIDRRLHMLLWHYADRWGKVSAVGITLDVPLTHAVLAELVGARRPTVSTALSSLGNEGKVARAGDRWRLLGDPPVELEEEGIVPAH